MQYNIDSSKELFSENSVTLNIVFNDGSEKSYPGLSKDEVEDFMEWLSRRQRGIGPIFYTIESGGSHYFINYYMIQSVRVSGN